MKDKLKNTLEHEIELLGRSISVLAIAGLLVIGGTSAALLNSFGTVSGEATVDQAVTVGDVAADEDDTFDQSYSFNLGTAPYEFSDSTTIENNLDQQTSVNIQTERTLPGTDETSNEEVSEGGFDTGYMLLRNGEAFSEGGASAEYVYHNDQAAVEVSNDGENDGSAGLSFEVDATFDGSNSVAVSYDAGADYPKDAPDWIFYEVEVNSGFAEAVNDDEGVDVSDGDTVRVIDASIDAESGTSLRYGEGEFGDDVLVFDESGENLVTDDDSVINDNLQGQEIQTLNVATGTDDEFGAGQDSSLYYTGVDFNGNDLTETWGTSTKDLTLQPQEQSEFGVANSVAINAYPGTYSVTTDVVPQTE